MLSRGKKGKSSLHCHSNLQDTGIQEKGGSRAGEHGSLPQEQQPTKIASIEGGLKLKLED